MLVGLLLTKVCQAVLSLVQMLGVGAELYTSIEGTPPVRVGY